MTLLRSKAVTTAAISAGGVLQLSKGGGRRVCPLVDDGAVAVKAAA